MKKQTLIRCIVLVVCMLPYYLSAQKIVKVAVDSVACSGDSVLLSVGFDTARQVTVANRITSISHPGRVFLPDGMSCGTLGCSYRSPVTFSDFEDTAVISSANDINFVRLNLEHSYIGDIYINITCPNGQTASLMNYSNGGTSDCTGSIPTAHRGWSAGSNMSGGTYFGQAYDFGNATYKCDSTASNNEPGIGWNYCWSNNTTNGYSYAHANASDDGIIYRAGHAHSGRVDSSNVAAGTNFYHPEENFSNLIGCPINGDWYIEVIDGFSQDNGYIFDWELSLNPELVPMAGLVTGHTVLGSEVTVVNDSTYLLSTPDSTHGDTTVAYTVRIFSSNGSIIDTTVSVHYYPTSYLLVSDTLCDGDTLWFDTIAITETTVRSDTTLSPLGCLAVTEFNVLFTPVYRWTDTARFCFNEPYIYNGVIYADTGNYLLADTTVMGCDSTLTLTLELLDPDFRAMPLVSEDGEVWRYDTMLAGCVPYPVLVWDTSPSAASHQWLFGDGTEGTLDSMAHTYDSAGIYNITLCAQSIHGCRDTAMIKSAVWTFDNPEADFEWAPSFPVMSHPTAEFFNRSLPSGLTFHWLMQSAGGETDTLLDVNPTYTWGNDEENIFGDFEVTLEAVETYTGPYDLPVECIDTAVRTITIINDWLQFPNAVTPNGDGINDYWRVVNLLECGVYSMNELWIYNAWGVLVYHAENIDEESDFWYPDKTHSPDGTYYFRFSAKSHWGVVRTNGMIEVISE